VRRLLHWPTTLASLLPRGFPGACQGLPRGMTCGSITSCVCWRPPDGHRTVGACCDIRLSEEHRDNHRGTNLRCILGTRTSPETLSFLSVRPRPTRSHNTYYGKLKVLGLFERPRQCGPARWLAAATPLGLVDGLPATGFGRGLGFGCWVQVLALGFLVVICNPSIE
jgi:hypothetical protein